MCSEGIERDKWSEMDQKPVYNWLVKHKFPSSYCLVFSPVQTEQAVTGRCSVKKVLLKISQST